MTSAELRAELEALRDIATRSRAETSDAATMRVHAGTVLRLVALAEAAMAAESLLDGDESKGWCWQHRCADGIGGCTAVSESGRDNLLASIRRARGVT